MSNPAVRVVLGSPTDWEKANIVLGVLRDIGIPYNVSIASCHWHTGEVPEKDFVNFIRELEEDLIAYVGGLQFAAPGITETINKNSSQAHKIVMVVPTDEIAYQANENFPLGTVVFMTGRNSKNSEHDLKNRALGIAKVFAWRYPDLRPDLQAYYDKMKENKPLVKEVELVNGLIPDPKKDKAETESPERGSPGF